MSGKNNRLSRYILLVSVFALLGALTIADAKTTMWRWVDDKGKIHYTDELYRVPPKYQPKAVKVEIQEVTPQNNPDVQAPPPIADQQAQDAANEAQLKALWVAKAKNAVAEVQRIEGAVAGQDAYCTRLRRQWETMPVIQNQAEIEKCFKTLEQLKIDLAKAIEYKTKGIYKEAQGAGVPITWIDQILQQK